MTSEEAPSSDGPGVGGEVPGEKPLEKTAHLSFEDLSKRRGRVSSKERRAESGCHRGKVSEGLSGQGRGRWESRAGRSPGCPERQREPLKG